MKKIEVHVCFQMIKKEKGWSQSCRAGADVTHATDVTHAAARALNLIEM